MLIEDQLLHPDFDEISRPRREEAAAVIRQLRAENAQLRAQLNEGRDGYYEVFEQLMALRRAIFPTHLNNKG